MEESKIKENLLEKNEEFRKAFDQHKKLEEKLTKLNSKSYLTEDEKLKVKQIKKKKLLFKDKMLSMMSVFKKSPG